MQAQVVHHESPEFGRLERVERPLDPRLAGVVNRYCGFAHERTGTARRRELAQSQVTVILGFGPRLRVSGPDQKEVELESFVAPLHDTYAITEECDALHGIQVDLSPLGAHMVFGLAMHELSSRLVVPLEDALGGTPELLERLVQMPTWEDRFTIVDEFIAARVSVARRPSREIVGAWHRLAQTDGRVGISELAAELGYSHRRFVTRFREQVGPAPKTVARLLRFNRAVRLLRRDDGRRFAEIAQDCGYYDQAHMNRDFRDLGGTTPTSFLASVLPDGIGIAADG